MASPAQIDGHKSLLTALLLATAGGLTDVTVYLLHGHVFANAMTGNVVLLGASLMSHNMQQAVRHMYPLFAFLMGIYTARILRLRTYHRALIIGLLFQGSVYFLMPFFAARTPEPIVTSLLAFAASCQVANFRRVNRFSYNSTFITGNLRDMVEGFVDSRNTSGTTELSRRDGRDQAVQIGLICGCFFGGVLLGGWTSAHIGDYGLWIVVLLLLAVLGITLYHPPGPNPTR